MISTIADKTELRILLKELLIELLQERDEEISTILIEVIEDITLANAIEQGETTELVSRDTIFKILQQTP
jgi:hypothetical protein